MTPDRNKTAQTTQQRFEGVLASLNPLGFFNQLSDTRFWFFVLLAPATVIIAAIVVYPVVHGISLSLHEMRLTRPDLGFGFVGLNHYAFMLQDKAFWISMRNSILWLSGAIVLELSMGLISAMALNRRLPGLRLALPLILIPWFLPNVVVGNMWALMLDSRLGVINDVLLKLGILTSSRAWFADPLTALSTAIIIEAWHSFPFFTLIFMAGLRAVPAELYEAAAIDGANTVERFRHITLPMLRDVTIVAVILRGIILLSSPELLLILTHGGPGHSTMVLSLYAFETAYRGFDFGYGSALAVVLAGILMPFSYLYIRMAVLPRAGQ